MSQVAAQPPQNLEGLPMLAGGRMLHFVYFDAATASVQNNKVERLRPGNSHALDSESKRLSGLSLAEDRLQKPWLAYSLLRRRKSSDSLPLAQL